VFSNLFKKTDARIYLGDLNVASNGEIDKIEKWAGFKSQNIEGVLAARLKDIFSFAAFNKDLELQLNDLVLDVVIVNSNSGDLDVLNLTDWAVPLFFRPKIKMQSRLYNAKTGKTKYTFKVTQSVAWRDYFFRAISIRNLFGFGAMYNAKDMEALLMLASLTLLEKIKKAV
jgi:hypothetical protein